MASGDVASNYNITLTVGTEVFIQPAGSTELMITAMICNTLGGSLAFQGSGVTMAGGATNINALGSGGTTNLLGALTPQTNCKFFVNNSQYIGFRSVSGTTGFGYSAIEL